jgi:23S rRNA (cytosine1962-C5)-methyltransferase
MKEEIKIFYSKDWADYQLLDTGEGEKLEQVGKYRFIRPYEDAVWQKTLNKKEWENVDGKFWSSQKGAKAGWKLHFKDSPFGSLKDCPFKKWQISYKEIKFFVMPTPFRHFGFFPEQASHWDFIEEKIRSANSSKNFLETAPSETKGQGTHTFLKNSSPNSSQKIKFLNLFGYTGVASLFALRAGAEVTHLDASKQSLAWAKENQILSGLEKMPMRIICDDAMKFLEREAKRGNKYDCVIMDPPKFGRGPKGEIWKLEEMLPKLLENVKKILSNKPLFVILTSYTTDASSLSLGYGLSEIMKDFSGKTENGELCLLEKSNNRIISLANTAVWSSFEK